MLFSHLIIHRLQETLKWQRLRRAQRKPNQLKRVGCPSKIKSVGKQSSRAGKERSPGVVPWNRRQHIYLVLIHFACAGLWMSNKYAHVAPNGEDREAFGWGSCTVTRLDECVSNSKHVAVMCLMGGVVPRFRGCHTKDCTVPGLEFRAHPSCRPPSGCTIHSTVQVRAAHSIEF